MNKIILIFLTLFVLNGCGYEPLLANKTYNFKLETIGFDNENEINSILKTFLNEKNKEQSEKKYNLNYSTKYEKETVSSNEKGDPVNFKIKIAVNYLLDQDGIVIFTNKINNEVNYNNINDKFELLKYEENIVNSLLRNIADEILFSIARNQK